jgi:chitin synthase
MMNRDDYLNVLLCVKHKNDGKLSSHALFFLGFGGFMQPEFCLLLDVGLAPEKDAIYKMFQYMDKS